MAEATFWNGEPCPARLVQVLVTDPGAHQSPWYRPFVGTWRDAVEVVYAGHTFYLDDEGYEVGEEERALLGRFGIRPEARKGEPGWGWRKVTEGRGSPGWGHASLYAAEVREREPTDG